MWKKSKRFQNALYNPFVLGLQLWLPTPSPIPHWLGRGCTARPTLKSCTSPRWLWLAVGNLERSKQRLRKRWKPPLEDEEEETWGGGWGAFRGHAEHWWGWVPVSLRNGTGTLQDPESLLKTQIFLVCFLPVSLRPVTTPTVGQWSSFIRHISVQYRYCCCSSQNNIFLVVWLCCSNSQTNALYLSQYIVILLMWFY